MHYLEFQIQFEKSQSKLKDISPEKFSYLLIILTLELSGMGQIDY